MQIILSSTLKFPQATLNPSKCKAMHCANKYIDVPYLYLAKQKQKWSN